MPDPATPVTGPPPELRYRRRLRPSVALRDLWRAREVVRSLVDRELRVRYAQAFLGLAWALLAPLTLMVVFTLFFNRVAKIDTGNVTYALFSYAGLLPWTFFASAVSTAGISLVQNVALLNKVYCPREVFPLASIVTSAVDSLCASAAFIVLFAVYGFMPKATAIWVPVLLLILVAFTTAVSLVVAAVTVYLRDLRHALALILQLGLFASPVLYRLETVPSDLRTLYVAANPIAAVIDGMRRTLLYGQAPDGRYTAIAAAVALVALAAAYALFKRLETGMADVA
jgi:ABC-2 type transport system permease protein/lipopolysaccharide transport system permease protein